MILRPSQDVLNDPRWHSLLDVVVELIVAGTHRLSFDSRDLNSITASSWLRSATGARGTLGAIIKSSVKAAARSTLSDAITLHIDATAPTLGRSESKTIVSHPLGALAILAQPFHIIVEDETSDGAFLLWMSRYLGRDDIIAAYKSGRLLFRHAGGKGQIPKSASALSYGVWPRQGVEVIALKYRCAAVLDSDAKYPGDTPNSAIASETERHTAFVHILNCRTIENYVPQKYFRRRLAADGLASLADTFFRIPQSVRDMFPIKAGFKDALTSQPLTLAAFVSDNKFLQAERNLHATAAAADWDAVSQGFGERLATVFLKPEYRCNPNEMSGVPAAHRDELNALITRIVRHL